MGKPKAIRNRDVIPKVNVDAKARKHVNFDEIETDNSAVEVDSVNVESIVATTATETLDNKPEEVKIDVAEIQRLKELHEQLIGTKRRAPKRKIETVSAEEADRELDFSVLEAVDRENNAKESTHDQEDSEEDEENDGVSHKRLKIDKNLSKSKKIGNIVVSVLNKHPLNPISNFKMMSTALAFQAECYSANKRINYKAFVNQRKGSAIRTVRRK